MCFSFSDVLLLIFNEVKTTNDTLKKKVADLEKKVDELRDEHTSASQTNAIKPSREVRVCIYSGT